MTADEHHSLRQQGFSLVLILSLVALLSIMLITYSLLTVNNARTAKASGNSSAGFYAAEAALNARADRVRGLFKGFRAPTGTSPSQVNACTGTNLGSGDLQCETTVVAGRSVNSYVWRSENPYPITVPAGERFAGLIGEETPFSVRSQALNASGNPEAIATMTFRSRVIPLFQFAVFFDKDMEFDNTAKLDFSGPVHSNGNIFLDSGTGSDTSLTLRGQITAAVDIYRRQKRDDTCQGIVKIAAQDTNLIDLPCNGDINTPYTNDYYKTRYGGTVQSNIGRLEVPSIEALQPKASAEYWQKADLRIVLKKTSGVSNEVGTYQPYFVTSNGNQILAPTCISPLANPSVPLAVSYSTTFRDTREARYWESIGKPERSNKILLDIDVRKLLSCIESPVTGPLLGISDGLQNTTEGGLVIYMTVDDRGPAGSTVTSSLLNTPLNNGSNGAIAQSDPPAPNNYGIRLFNGSSILSLSGSKPKGVTFVTDQAAFIQGDFNNYASDNSNWVPTAILADSMNILSNNWVNPAPTGKHEFIGYDSNDSNSNGWLSSTCWRRSNGTWTNAAPCPAVNLYGSTFSGRTLYKSIKPVTNSAGISANYYVYDDADIANRFPISTFSLGSGTASSQAVSFTLENGKDIKSQYNLPDRLATETTVNAAILAGTATTAEEGKIYTNLNQDLQSGGVHNMMRFHEEWGGNGGHPNGIQKYNYRGSLVSLDKPQHVAGSFRVGAPTYNPPLRQWAFETNFRQSAKLPPLTPRFIYIKQENFTRDFQQ
ncbi:hypothetical protein GCM10008956_26790 [Deinococcus arenae]|uniref:Type 4 fimbrial biogenesis protein PilX N-terminal domain-containing protein n=1 Tax=Deinococcus arenae TaxID=1452751 RepID=A0A8H9L7V7_9DEIO|nr:hypothetical protein [Deinococcus arenae]GGM49325.1 hypothetical protein GCM10008956_26790 [Deinococcus arenae]